MFGLILLCVVLGVITVVLAVVLRYALKDNSRLWKESEVKELDFAIEVSEIKERLQKEVFRNKSIEVRTGQIAERLAPFLEIFPKDPKKVVHLGMPIDFICFDEDEITFIEVKSGGAKLTTKQRRIRNLIKEKKVAFLTVRIK